MTLFRLLFTIDAVAAGLIGLFFLWGVADGTVSAFNIGLWLAMLGGVAAVLAGGWALKRKGKTAAANAVLAILAVPAGLFGIFFLAVMLLQPRWN